MKKYLILLSIWALAFTTIFASGLEQGENILVKFQKGELEKTVIVRLANLEKQTTEVGILDTDGAFWFSQFIRKEHGYATQFNMNDMPEGEYILFIQNKTGIWAQAFTMDQRDIAFFDKPSDRPTNQAVASLVSLNARRSGKLITNFNVNGELKIGVQLANLQNQPTFVEIISVNQGVLYTKTVKNEIGMYETLNLKGAPNGYYILYVHGIDASVVQFFSIENGNELSLGELQRLERPALEPNEGFSANY